MTEIVAKSFEVLVPATTANIGPGFDCFGMALSLYNKILIQPSDSLKIQYTGLESDQNIPLDKSNLLYQSIHAVFKKCGYTVPPLSLSIENNIPLSRGLGSSSATIVAGLTIGNYLLGNCLSEQDLLCMANDIEGHPDNVVPALVGGFTIAFEQDRQICYQQLVWPSQWLLTALIPDITVSTAQAREVLPKQYHLSDIVYNIQRASLLVSAIYDQDKDKLKIALADRLHEPYRYALIHHAVQVKKDLLHLPEVLGVIISGSGSTLLLISEINVDVTVLLDQYWTAENISYKVKSLKPVQKGVKVYETSSA